LAEIARGLNLGRYITLGRSEKLDGGAEKINILSDALEALLAAVYCDGGMHEADKIIEHLWQPLLNSAVVPQDAKSALQEWLQARGQALPVYSVLSQTGNAQAQTFTVQVQAGEYGTTTGVGNSKRAAEQQAAQALLERLKKDNT
jgi:ribonuclease-3